MSAPLVRRNDPCPCGSGRRYKECHGRLAPEDPLEAKVRQALLAHQQGRVEEAERGYGEILASRPGHPVATHYLGMVAWQRGDLARAEALMRAALAAEAGIPDFHNNLGLLLRDTHRIGDAIACFEKTLAVDPGWFEAHNNLGLALEAAGRWDDAIAAYRRAIAAQPAFAAARQNLARALLTVGRFPEAWEQYRWRLVGQGLTHTPPDPRAEPFPARLAARRLALVTEQGIGDVLFFLRFAPELVRRGALLAFRGDPRLRGMLERTALFALGVDEPHVPCEGAQPVFIGDLPWLLEANAPAQFPPPLPVTPREDEVRKARAQLEALGPHPWVGLTWRAGVAPSGPARTQLKDIEPGLLGQALRGTHATWIAVQRHPVPGKREHLAQALQAPVHDFSRANDDLDAMLALQSVLDGYVTVSNANVHLRAGVAGAMHVLVPNPVEWRWSVAGATTPWFPSARVFRQAPDGDWAAALAALRASLA